MFFVREASCQSPVYAQKDDLTPIRPFTKDTINTPYDAFQASIIN